MRYLMKQKVFSWGDNFVIKDADGKDCFVVDGKAFSFGAQLSFRDLAGHELVYIKQQWLSWQPTYEIYKDAQVRAVIKKELFTLFKCRFTVDVPGPDDLQAQGDFIDLEYEISRGERKVASVSKQWFSWSDTYGVDIADGEDNVLILASTVVIDMACHAER